MKHIFIINPAAGKGAAEKLLPPVIKATADEASEEYEIYISKSENDIEKFVKKRAAGGEGLRFYACGGDGTLSEVINGIEGFPLCEAGCVPMGSGNDFIKNFINKEFFLDIKRQIKGRPVYVDAIRYNGRIAINMLNIGMDADSAYAMQKIKGYPFVTGPFAYIAGVGVTAVGRLGIKLNISVDGEAGTYGDFILAAVANGSFYGGGFKTGASAKLNDGLLDICTIKKVGRLTLIGMMEKYKNGEFLNDEKIMKNITYKKCRSLVIESENEARLCADGELIKSKRTEISVMPRAVKFSLPEGTELQI